MDTRRKERVPYEDLCTSSSEPEADDPKDGDFECSELPTPYFVDQYPVSKTHRKVKKSKTKPKIPIGHSREPEPDEFDTYRLSLASRATGFAVNYRVCKSDPSTNIGPKGNRCPCFRLDEIRDKLLDPDKYFPRGATGVNVFMPEWDIPATNKLQFFWNRVADAAI